MRFAIHNPSLRRSVFGAALAGLAGLLLWGTSPGEPWANASYDFLFRFGSRAVTNRVTLLLMDNAAFDQLHQARGQPWDRALHAQLLNRLADDGCELVVMDSFFREARDPKKDDALAAAMRRQRHLVLMAEQSQVTHPGLVGAQPVPPLGTFREAAGQHWGVAWLDPDLDGIVRRQWPFPNPGPYPSLPWMAAQQAGARLEASPQKRWLRYYGAAGAWTRLSYPFALDRPPGYFRGQIVFIGTAPHTTVPGGETDKFSTPYTRWTGEASGGADILITAFLNLLNDDSLQRPPAGMELALLTLAGMILGAGLGRLTPWAACGVAAVIFLTVTVAGVWLSHFSHYWFPWLIIGGGQLPCALAWAVVTGWRRAPGPIGTARDPLPETPGYEFFSSPFAEGAYGKVWLARNADGEWRALKVISLAQFDGDADPYEREFEGIRKYQPVSGRHPGLLRVDFVSEKKAGYFYYVMELGDAIAPGWEENPALYQPRNLVSERAQLRGRRLPVRTCVELGLSLSEALDFLHGQGLTHRDIKPPNIIFVGGRPKLADLGLITGIRELGHEGTLVGTPGYLPPAPERPGTVQADIYSLGMVLYVLCTGRAAALFPEVATTLVSAGEPPEFLPLNHVILKACQPLPEERYASAAKMRAALETVRAALSTESPTATPSAE